MATLDPGGEVENGALFPRACVHSEEEHGPGHQDPDHEPFDGGTMGR
jgi:hypothetical protein